MTTFARLIASRQREIARREERAAHTMAKLDERSVGAMYWQGVAP